MQELSSKSILKPKLPGDILYLVAQFSTFETRARLVQCDRWFHKNCTSLLFKDIYLHSPAKLIQLLINEKARRMLSRTDSIYLDKNLLSSDYWSDQLIEVAPDLIITLLSAANSLSRLQVYAHNEKDEPEEPLFSHEDMDKHYSFYSKLNQELESAAFNLVFLPNLTTIIDYPETFSFEELCPGRPVVYYYHDEGPDMHVDICPSWEKPGSGPSLKPNLSAYDIGVLIRDSGFSSPTRPGGYGLRMRIRFPEEIERGAPGPVEDPVSWTKTMLAASEIDYLCRLEVSFEPDPPCPSLVEQLTLVAELHEEFPELEDLCISYPRSLWSRSTDHEPYESKYFSEDLLPEWTLRPDARHMSDWMEFWLGVLGLPQEPRSLEEITQITDKLMDGIGLRWEVESTVILEAALRYLIDNKPRSD